MWEVPASFFVLEDRELTKAASKTLATLAVLDAGAAELPILYANSRCADLCGGAPREGLVGTDLAQALQLSPSSTEQLAAALEQGSTACLQLEAAARPLDATFAPVTDASSGLLLYWVACLDQQAQAENAAAEPDAAEPDFNGGAAEGPGGQEEQAARRFAPAMFTAGSVEGQLGAGCIIEVVNEQFVELTGYSRADLGGVGGLGRLFGPDTEEGVAAKIAAAIASHQAGAWSVLLYRKDGSCRWCYMSTFPLPSCIMCVCMDVTAATLARIGSYSVGRVIGQGTYGTVRIGIDEATGELVALKMVDTRALKHIDELQQLQDEIGVLSTLRHPRIIRLYGVQQVQDRMLCFIMEYARGGSLKTYMDSQENRVLSEARAKQFFEQMVNAVDYCHRRRVVHRDLKPENILLDEEGRIKIADFGLAGWTTPFDGNLTETCGTIEFTAPEVLTRQEYNGAAADMWSLGAVIYELLMGRSPYKGPNAAAIIKAACKGVYPDLPDTVSPQCKDLLAGLLRVDPEARMTMEEVVCHKWVLGDLDPAAEEAASPGWPEGAVGDTSSSASGVQSSTDIDPSGGITSRHNSLRLVVPGSQLDGLPAVAEEGEQGASGAAGVAKPSSPRRSVEPAAQQQRSPKLGAGHPASPTRDTRRSRSSASKPAAQPTLVRTARSHGSAELHTVQLAFGGLDVQAKPARAQRSSGC